MSDTPTHFVERAFASRMADLGFTLRLPESWQPQDLPDEEPDFDDPLRLFGLGAAAAPYAALVFAAAARPAFADGTVLDWARWLIEHNAVALRALGPSQLGALPAILGQCTADGGLGPMVTHFAFAEDGARLIHLSVTGPQALGSHVWQVWREIVGSFALAQPRGATVPLAPPATVHQPGAGASTGVDDVGSFALGGGLATLQQDHPTNRAWLEQGRGFAPRVRAVDGAAGKAWVASIALQAVLEVPLGWHALDDGVRLVLLHPDGSVQISLERLQAPGGSQEALLDRLEAQARIDYPAPQAVRLRSGPILGLALHNLFDGDQPLRQMHLLLACDPPGTVLRARATAVPEQAARAADLAEALLLGVRSGQEGEVTPNSAEPGPDWARRACALEAQGRLEEAERAMLDGCDQQGVLMSIACLYRQRMQRLAAAGDAAGAADARQRARDWAWRYAAGATSGGEGLALSRERDEFIRTLGPD